MQTTLVIDRSGPPVPESEPRTLGRAPAALGATLIAVALMLAAAAPSEAAKKRKRGPVNAKVTVDKARAATAKITVASGGTISVRARNGTRVTVKFPAGAVAEDTLVTATPVTRLVSRPTRKGLLTGVQLQPEGLQLLKPATVRFTRRGKAPKKTLIVFVGTHGNGRDLYVLPPPVRISGRGKKRRFVRTGQPVVSITHFSTVDAFDWSTATLADIFAIVHPEVGVHRMSHELSKLLADKNTTLEEFVDAYERERKRFIDPLIQQTLAGLNPATCSVKSIRRAHEVMQIALSFSRQAEIFVGADSTTLVAVSEILTAAGVCVVSLCPKTGDPTAGAYLLSVARKLSLIGGANQAFIDALAMNMERCGAHEVRIDARIDTKAEAFAYSYRVVGKVEVRPSTTKTDPPPPRGTLEYTAASGTSTSKCVVTAISKTTNGEFELTEELLTLFDPDKPANNPVSSLKIKITVSPTETYHSTPTGAANCGTSTPPDFDNQQWFVGFQGLHPGFTFAGADFLRDAPPVFALAVYVRTVTLAEGFSLGENTRIEIVHTPLPPVPLPDPTPDGGQPQA